MNVCYMGITVPKRNLFTGNIDFFLVFFCSFCSFHWLFLWVAVYYTGRSVSFSLSHTFTAEKGQTFHVYTKPSRSILLVFDDKTKQILGIL